MIYNAKNPYNPQKHTRPAKSKAEKLFPNCPRPDVKPIPKQTLTKRSDRMYRNSPKFHPTVEKVETTGTIVGGELGG